MSDTGDHNGNGNGNGYDAPDDLKTREDSGQPHDFRVRKDKYPDQVVVAPGVVGLHVERTIDNGRPFTAPEYSSFFRHSLVVALKRIGQSVVTRGGVCPDIFDFKNKNNQTSWVDSDLKRSTIEDYVTRVPKTLFKLKSELQTLSDYSNRCTFDDDGNIVDAPPIGYDEFVALFKIMVPFDDFHAIGSPKYGAVPMATEYLVRFINPTASMGKDDVSVMGLGAHIYGMRAGFHRVIDNHQQLGRRLYKGEHVPELQEKCAELEKLTSHYDYDWRYIAAAFGKAYQRWGLDKVNNSALEEANFQQRFERFYRYLFVSAGLKKSVDLSQEVMLSPNKGYPSMPLYFGICSEDRDTIKGYTEEYLKRNYADKGIPPLEAELALAHKVQEELQDHKLQKFFEQAKPASEAGYFTVPLHNFELERAPAVNFLFSAKEGAKGKERDGEREMFPGLYSQQSR